MRNIFFILFVVFTVSSCTYEHSGFRQITKEEAMQSWAWKIFIFTDEGEVQPIEPENNFYKSLEDKPIFVDDLFEMNLKNDLFLKNYGVAFTDKDYKALLKVEVKNK